MWGRISVFFLFQRRLFPLKSLRERCPITVTVLGYSTRGRGWVSHPFLWSVPQCWWLGGVWVSHPFLWSVPQCWWLGGVWVSHSS
ncbi:hypothetical protein KPH14_012749 [Odynerus spinipes]|uniref:Uncharacterized protein n=1 Tax=Odynerus spinipes TaxID=1348599 RepID=A0AAD9RFL1_9HYME|nr:hypothetical protein KPH14_012749 [Odynerus spinipes]